MADLPFRAIKYPALTLLSQALVRDEIKRLIRQNFRAPGGRHHARRWRVNLPHTYFRAGNAKESTATASRISVSGLL